MCEARLRILHLTDLHMRSALPGTAAQPERKSRDIARHLETLARRLQHWRPDVVVITGDLLDVPDNVVDESLADKDPEGFRSSVELATLDYQWMRGWLGSTGVPWVVIPGNHDHRGAFTGVFGTVSPDVIHCGWRFIGFDDILDARRAPVRPQAACARFAAALASTASAEPQVHLQHYLLRPRIHRRTPYSYAPEAGLAARVSRSATVKAALSGHSHPGAFTQDLSGTVFSTAPAFCEAPFPFRLLELTTDGGANISDQSLQ